MLPGAARPQPRSAWATSERQPLDDAGMAHMYILECADGSYYVGSTTRLDLRIAQHQSGDGAVYTRRRRPVRLVFAAEFDRVDEAFAFEKQVQGWSRAKRRALIDGRLHDLPGLSRTSTSRSE
jgi:putative endonuclease